MISFTAAFALRAPAEAAGGASSGISETLSGSGAGSLLAGATDALAVGTLAAGFGAAGRAAGGAGAVLGRSQLESTTTHPSATVLLLKPQAFRMFSLLPQSFGGSNQIKSA